MERCIVFEVQNRAAEFKIRYVRKAGQMLIEMLERGDRRGKGGKWFHDETSSLKELGIDKILSHRWQLLARIDGATGKDSHAVSLYDLGRG